MSTTTNLGITEISSSQTQKEVTANTAFDQLDRVQTDLYTLSVAGGADVTANAASATFSRRIKLTGLITANINLILPTLKKEYVIDNQTTGKFTVTVKMASGTGVATYGTGWGHAAGDIRYLYADGTNVVSADSRLGGRPDATLVLSAAITLPALVGRQMVFVSTPSVDVAVTLPSASGIAGARIGFKKTDAVAHNVVVTGTIEGATNFTISQQNQVLEIESDGTNWKILEAYNPSLVNFSPVANQWINAITNGVPQTTQPTFGDISGILTVTAGGTGANLSATGGTSRVLKQTSVGGVITVAQLALADLSDYAEGTWTPVATNLANTGGAPTLTGTYTKIGRQVTFTIKIVPVTNSSSTAASTSITLPSTPARNAVCDTTDDAVANLGTGLVKTDGSVYPPAWTNDTGAVYITGSYELT